MTKELVICESENIMAEVLSVPELAMFLAYHMSVTLDNNTSFMQKNNDELEQKTGKNRHTNILFP